MKKSRITIISVTAAVAVIAFLFFLNHVMISVRLNELVAGLKDIDRAEASIDHIGLVATYEVHKKLFENRISQDGADEIEQRIQSLRVLKEKSGGPLPSFNDILTRPALGVINFNRAILGKPPLRTPHIDDPLSPDMDLAYYYERNMHFDRAIKLYDKALARPNLASETRAGALLHQGYCYALADREAEARRNYMNILENHARENSAVTAAILLRYLDGFSAARRVVLTGNEGPFMRSRKLMNLLAYRQALTILETVGNDANAGDQAALKYFKARCLAGLGRTQKAAENYLEVITSFPASRYAKYSNRKLFMIGSSQGNAAITGMAAKINGRLKDPLLERMMEESAPVPGPVIRPGREIAVEIPPEMAKKINIMTAEKKKASFPRGASLIVYTDDGNIFKGKVIEDGQDQLSLDTSIGVIKVRKDRISRTAYK